MANRVLALRDLTAPLEKDAPWPGTALSGDPHTKTWNLYTSDDGKLLAGIWESTPGVWKIDYDAWEYCHLLAGRCTIEIEGKAPVHLIGAIIAARPIDVWSNMRSEFGEIISRA